MKTQEEIMENQEKRFSIEMGRNCFYVIDIKTKERLVIVLPNDTKHRYLISTSEDDQKIINEIIKNKRKEKSLIIEEKDGNRLKLHLFYFDGKEDRVVADCNLSGGDLSFSTSVSLEEKEKLQKYIDREIRQDNKILG